MNQDSDQPGSTGDILLYEAAEGRLRLEVRLQDETLWLTQNQLAELFQTTQQNISGHIQNVYAEGELEREATHKKFLSVQLEGGREVRRQRDFYNLDIIIAVGYRVKSAIATRFRIWATERLKEYIIKGFVMDDERLKEPQNDRYFEELLARIRDIRSSEKVFWRKMLDIYATSTDYDPKAEQTQLFFKQVQNKMHWAAHGHTASELIFQRADASAPNMGITNFSGKNLLKRDIEVAKNYLTEEELNILNRIVNAYLELAEVQALNRQPMTMADWQQRLDQFLTMTGRELLTHAGSISNQLALNKAHQEFERFREQRLQQPSEAEKHFIEAEMTLKQLKSPQRSGKKEPRH
ncbi:virulence RhuM family protein [Halomonas sp. LS-001]